MRMMGASFKKALAMEIRCLSPPDSSEPFSPIMVCQPSGSFSANSSQCASFAAASTSSSVASCLPIRMFSITVLLNSVTSWNTIAYRDIKVSGSMVEMSIPPTVILPFSMSQKREANLDTVVLPPPEGPISAVTSPCFAVKVTSRSTVS